MMSTDVPRFSLKYPLMTAMAMSSLNYLDICLSAASVVVGGTGSTCVLLICVWSSRMMLGYSCAFYDPWDQFPCNYGYIFLCRD